MDLTLDYHLLLDRGLSRERNEDRCGAFVPESGPVREQRGRLFVVADGMGGHAAGDVAAELAVHTIKEAYFDNGWAGPDSQLANAFIVANESILQAAREGGRQGMGAAAVAAAIVDQCAYVAHLGDCRGYVLRGRQSTRVTADHSWVEERMAAGRLTADEARAHPYRNVLTRALGAEASATPDVSKVVLAPGDALVLCSDGLWGVTEDAELAQAVASSTDAQSAARALVDLALARGGPDNISVIVVRVMDTHSEAPTVQMVRP